MRYFGPPSHHVLAVFCMLCVSRFLLPEVLIFIFHTFNFYSKTVKKGSMSRESHEGTSLSFLYVLYHHIHLKMNDDHYGWYLFGNDDAIQNMK